MPLPPEPWLVKQYFERRVQASYETGYTLAQQASNNRLWEALCIEGAKALRSEQPIMEITSEQPQKPQNEQRAKPAL